MAYSVDIRDDVAPALEGLSGGLTAGRVGPMIGAAVKLLFQRHFLARGTNKQGWPSTGFWPDMARSTSWNLLAVGVLISVNKQGARQRLFGGEIHPVNSKYLTIPARAEAYGKRASEFNNLMLAFHRVGGRAVAWALVEAPATTFTQGKRRKDGSRKTGNTQEVGGLVFFWLVTSVNQAADPETIPSDAEITETAVEAVASAVLRALKQK